MEKSGEIKNFLPSFFQKSWRFPKAEPLVARKSEMGVWGLAPAQSSFKKVFCQTFSKKSLSERSSLNRSHQIPSKPRRATIGRPCINKFIIPVQQIRRLSAAQAFFGKSLPKNFLERLKGGGKPPHPHFAHSSDQRLCLWKPPAFLKKSWAKNF